MKVLHYKMDEGLHKQMKVKCVDKCISMNNYVVKLIEKDLLVETSPAAEKIKPAKKDTKAPSKTPKVDYIMQEWDRKSQKSSQKKDPKDMNSEEVKMFLSVLQSKRNKTILF